MNKIFFLLSKAKSVCKYILKSFFFFPYALPLYHKYQVRKLRRKDKINVVFIAISVSMWRYENLIQEMQKYKKFNISILISPSISYTKEQQEKDREDLIQYFQERNQPFLNDIKEDGNLINLREELKPDILFYPQPYEGIYKQTIDYYKFKDKLLCYIPYGFWMTKDNNAYNLGLHNLSWQVFYPTNLHQKDAKEMAYNKGKNIKIVGYPNADNFLFKTHYTPWKKQEKEKKKIIWAPHHSICNGQGTFLSIANFMLQIATDYFEEIQLTFKPHPRLYTALCEHKDWGKEKASTYYKLWKTMENTQLETGNFIDLFMTSDAMIHDSGSFCVEYHYTGKPVMYIAKDFEDQLKDKGEFGKKAMQLHYVGKSKDDILSFIENIVLNENDPQKEAREQFRQDYLLPPNGKTVAQNMVDVLLKAFC